MLDFLPEQYDQDRLPATNPYYNTFFSKKDTSRAEHTEALNSQNVSYRRTHCLIEVSLRKRCIYTWQCQTRAKVRAHIFLV